MVTYIQHQILSFTHSYLLTFEAKIGLVVDLPII